MDWHKYVEIDQRYLRPSEVDCLMGDASKAKMVLKWEPKVTFKELARLMTDADMEIAKREKLIKEQEEAK
ncbi:GDP-mannose 4,6-dehydratase [subsurface metagenome]